MRRALGLAIAAFVAVTISASAFVQDQVIRVGNLITDAASGPSAPATIIVRDGKIDWVMVRGHIID